MAKSKKKSAKKPIQKAVKKKVTLKLKKTNGNKKKKLATSKKSVKAKVAVKPKSLPKKKIATKVKPIKFEEGGTKIPSAPKNPSTKKRTQTRSNENTTESRSEPSNPPAPQNPTEKEEMPSKAKGEPSMLNDEGKHFEILQDVELLGGSVKLSKGATAKHTAGLKFELRGKDAGGQVIGTILDCIDEIEEHEFKMELSVLVHEGKAELKDDAIATEQPAEQKPIDVEGKIIDDVNMDDLIKNLSTMEEQQNAMNQNPFPVAQQNPMFIQPQILMGDDQNLSYMETYGKSILDTTSETFQARVQGGLPIDEFKKMLASCDATLSYELKKDDNGYFLNISKGTLLVRIPKEENQYLPVR